MKNKFSFSVAILLILSMLVCKYNAFEKKNKENPYPIAYDIYGYYLYLPATFIYHDPGLENRSWLKTTQEKHSPSPSVYQYTKGKGDRQVIIYNIGYSFVYAPGFFIAHWVASSLGYEADGFSKPYQFSLEITAFILSLIGLFMFRKIALRFFSDKITAALIVTVLIGSNYFFQITYDGVMPHNILFTINCFIIWYTIKWHEEKRLKHIVLAALFLGLASICRPTELIWILLPLFWGVQNKASLKEKFKLLFRHYLQVFIFGVLLFLIICIQLFYLKYATGYFRAFNLHSERFSFFDPYTIKFLFSYKKGWLLYTPVMIFAIAGFYFLYKQNKKIWLPLFLFFAINLYVVSSWECWWYAASFGQRPMVESYAMMLFPLGYFLTWINENKKRGVRYSLSFILTMLIVLNLFQTWQFLNGIIDPERMTKKYYWDVFCKTGFDHDPTQYLSINRDQSVFTDYDHYSEKYVKKEPFRLTFEQPVEGVDNNNIIDTTAAEGKKSFVLSSDLQYSKVYEQNYYDITSKSYVWIRASVWVYLTSSYTESNSGLVITTESRERAIGYSMSDYKNFNILPAKWTMIHLDFLTPNIRHRDDKIKIYFWNAGKKPVLIDDLKVEVFEPKIDYE